MTSNSDTPVSGFLPPRWFIRAAWKIHKALYRWSGGRFGLRVSRSDRQGLAYLTTTGRRTGVERGVMIGYFEEDNGVVTMAMNGWGAPEPAWWLNLQAQPGATLAMAGGATISVVGRRAVGEERDRLWECWRQLDNGLDGFAARRPTETDVVVLDRRAD